MSEYKFENTIGGKLLKKLDAAFRDCLAPSNSWLPEKFHDKVRGGRTLARLDQMCDIRDGITKHRKSKATKAENVENYRQQYAENGTFTYNGHTDDLQLYKNEMAFCTACPDIDLEN